MPYPFEDFDSWSLEEELSVSLSQGADYIVREFVDDEAGTYGELLQLEFIRRQPCVPLFHATADNDEIVAAVTGRS